MNIHAEKLHQDGHSDQEDLIREEDDSEEENDDDVSEEEDEDEINEVSL